jgi:hypothetical protein
MSIRVREERYMLLSLSVIFAAWTVLSSCWTGNTTVAIDNIDKAAFGPSVEGNQKSCFFLPPKNLKILFDFFAPAPRTRRITKTKNLFFTPRTRIGFQTFTANLNI